jgi:MYXO-CTERM domain-containing protein
MKLSLALAATVAALAVPAAAFAHVTVHPNALPSGAEGVITIDVPNELAGPATTRVAVKFPSGFDEASPEALPGWKVAVTYRKAGGKTVVDQVIWTSKTGIPKGQFVQFPVLAAAPEAKAGTTLTFKALQTYANGKVVRWIGGPSTDNPAPQVVIKPANAPAQDFPAGASAAKTNSTMHVAGAALISLLGLGGAALYRRRR